jgi:hypothetical protein
MVVVGFGIAALIVIVLLIVFNVRAGRNREQERDAVREPDAAQEPDAVREPDAAQEPDAVREPDTAREPAAEVLATSEADVNVVKTDTQDQIYRNAMRQMKSGKPENNPAPAEKKKTSDSEYREAMRKLRKPPNQ